MFDFALAEEGRVAVDQLKALTVADSLTGKTTSGKLKQMKHNKCLGAVTAELSGAEITDVREVACEAGGLTDVAWSYHSCAKQIRLKDRDLCLQAIPDGGHVRAYPCVVPPACVDGELEASTDPDFPSQQWEYDPVAKEIKHLSPGGEFADMCLATRDTDPAIYLAACGAYDDKQKWKLITDSEWIANHSPEGLEEEDPGELFATAPKGKTMVALKGHGLATKDLLATAPKGKTSVALNERGLAGRLVRRHGGLNEVVRILVKDGLAEKAQAGSLDESLARKNSEAEVEAEVQVPCQQTACQGKVRQTEHDKCMAAVTTTSGDTSATQLEEVSCGTANPLDMEWKYWMTHKQIRLQNRDLCLQSEPSTKELFAFPCVSPTVAEDSLLHPDLVLQQWTYSSESHEIKQHTVDPTCTTEPCPHLCLATSHSSAKIFLAQCSDTDTKQKWEIQFDAE